jgi:DNA-binding MarR family transcriptional regulator
MLSNMIDDTTQDFRHTIMRLARRMRAERADSSISDAQSSVLFSLSGNGPQTLRSLSDRERVTPPSMNRTVNALLGANLVTRDVSRIDRRQVIIALSPTGESLVAETLKRRDAWFAVRLSMLPSEDRAVLEKAAPILRELADL